MTNLTYDHEPPMVQRYNKGSERPEGEPLPQGSKDGGWNQSRQERDNDFNDTSQLRPMDRSANSSKGGGTDESGERTTYTDRKGSDFTE